MPYTPNAISHEPVRDRRTRLTFAIFTALLMVGAALLLLVAAFASPHGAVQAARPQLGSWQLVPPVTNTIVHDVHMVSSSLGWAVGDAGTLLRYNGAAWQQVPISTTDDLIDVFMLSATDGYIVGRSPSGGEIFHFNGTSWPLEYNAPSELTRLDASSPTNVWAVGLNVTVHWNGSQWSVVPIPVQRQLFAVQANSDTDIWATGQYEPVSNTGLILHNNGSGWVQVASPSPQSLFDAFFTSPNDGWTLGYDVDIYHYNGTAWSFAYANPLQLSRLFMLSASEGWGISEVTNDIAHYNGTGFTRVNNPGPLGTYPISIYMDSAYDGWIVGGEGLMLHYTDSAPPTVTPTRTPTPCAITFTDVHPTDYFYDAVRYLYCRGAVSGYGDNTFRPFANTTRAQLAKIIVNAEGWSIDTGGGPHFNDVATGSAFYAWVETAYNHGIISGYACGGAGEPCPGAYFRPNANVTRGQLSKIIVSAQGWTVNTTGGPHFRDVEATNPFYNWIETAYNRTIISGYGCGGAGEPCPGFYFRWSAPATRGQISKIVYNAVTAP